MNEVLLVDLSSIAHPLFHVSASDPDPNATSTKTVGRVRALATGRQSVAICLDSGRSFRHDLDPTYKSNRPPSDAALRHQIALTKEILMGDGFPCWGKPGFEADDIIASATKTALSAGMDVLVVTADKDLLALVGPHVKAMSATTGNVMDEASVVEKFGVRADQITDYLTLVGDSADAVKGAKGIGPKKAAEILAKYGDLDTLYAKLDEAGPVALGLKPAEAASLEEFRARLPLVRALISLRDDVEIPFEEVLAERRPKDADSFGNGEPVEMQGIIPIKTDAVIDAEIPGTPNTVLPPVSNALAVREARVIEAAPAQWERQLDPRSMHDARELAKDLFASRMFSAYGTPQAVLSTIMMGRALGLDAMASLRGIFNVEGRHCISAQLMVALILKSGMAEYFRPVAVSDTSATYETLRKGKDQKPFSLTHTLDMAKTAGMVKPKSNWEKSPCDMLCARASSRLARLVFPDILFSLYTPEELKEMNND